MDQEFIPVRISTLRSDEVVPFDVFIRVGERLIHYIRQQDPFDKNRIESLKSKGVQKLFIPVEGETSYLTYLDAGLQHLQNTTMSVESRTVIANSAMMNLAGSAERSIQNEYKFRDMEGRVQKVLSFVNSDKNVARQMLAQSGIAQDELQHAANVNSLALMLAEKLGIRAPRDLLTLSIAALMHDIGKIGLDIDPKMAREDMSPYELEIYKSHPEKGAAMVANKPYVNPTIVSMILNHEEVGNGAGFPGKKRIESLPILQQVLNVCNEYDRMCTHRKLPPFVAAKTFFLEKVGLFPLDLVKALAEMLKA